MDCEHAKELFFEYHDGELPDSKRIELEKHLGECEACRAEWEDYSKTMREVSGMHRLDPSEDFVSRVKQTIGRRSRGRFFGEAPQFSLGFAIVSFVLILLVMLAYLFISAGTKVELVQPNNGDKTLPVDSDGN